MKVVRITLRITLLIAIVSLFTAGLIYSSDSGKNDWPRWRGSNMDGKALQTDVFKFDQGYGLKIGWKKQTSSEITDGVGWFDFKKGSLAITVTINPLREGMITTIVQGSGISVPKSLEQNDDDDDGQ